MKFSKLILAISFIALFNAAAFAQEYEPDVDSAWVAKQNGGSTELNNGETDEPAPACIGDGCDGTEQTQTAESATDTAKSAAADEEEDCTPADSLLPECQETASNAVDNDDDDVDTYDRYITEDSEISRSRKEGFSRRIRLGARVGGGMNMLFGKKSDDWKLGYEGVAGFFAKLPLGMQSVQFSVSLDFNYSRYLYEASTIYGEGYESDDDARIDMMLLEIPFIVQYAPDEEGFFFGLGFDLGLKLSSKSTYHQEIDSDKGIEKDKRKNTLPTSGVLMGGVATIGYAFTRWMSIDVRVSQYFTNLLNEPAIAESEVMNSQLYPFHAGLGLSFIL